MVVTGSSRRSQAAGRAIRVALHAKHGSWLNRGVGTQRPIVPMPRQTNPPRRRRLGAGPQRQSRQGQLALHNPKGSRATVLNSKIALSSGSSSFASCCWRRLCCRPSAWSLCCTAQERERQQSDQVRWPPRRSPCRPRLRQRRRLGLRQARPPPPLRPRLSRPHHRLREQTKAKQQRKLLRVLRSYTYFISQCHGSAPTVQTTKGSRSCNSVVHLAWAEFISTKRNHHDAIRRRANEQRHFGGRCALNARSGRKNIRSGDE